MSFLAYLKQALFHLILSSVLLGGLLFAQPIWLGKTTGNSFAFEALRPNFSEITDISTLSAAYFFSGQFQTKKTVGGVFELPLAFFSFQSNFSEGSKTAVGNPYIGLRLGDPDGNRFGEFGMRIPIAPEDGNFALFLGSFADLDRAEAFTPNLLSVSGKFNYFKKETSGMMFRLRGGPTIWIPTKGFGEVEALIDYSAQIGHEGKQSILLGGLTGRFLVTGGDESITERSFHHLGILAGLNFDGIRPGIHFRVPLDEDLQDRVDFILGLNIAVQLP